MTFPNYKFKILFEDASLPSIEKTIITQDADGRPGEFAYRIKRNKKNELVLQFFSHNPIQQSFNPGAAPADMGVVNFRTSETVNNTVFMGTSVSTTTTTVVTPGVIGMNVNSVDPVTGEVINMNVGVGLGTVGGTVTTTTTTTTTGGGYVGMSTPPPAQGCIFPMNARDFDAAKASIRGQSFEDNRLSTAKNVASSNCLSAMQVKEICQLFSFEESKLDFAQFAYTRCTERNMYFIINDVFSFSSSIEELNRYISTVR